MAGSVLFQRSNLPLQNTNHLAPGEWDNVGSIRTTW